MREGTAKPNLRSETLGPEREQGKYKNFVCSTESDDDLHTSLDVMASCCTKVTYLGFLDIRM